MSKGRRKRTAPRAAVAVARPEPPAARRPDHDGPNRAGTGERPAYDDETLPPWERGPVRRCARDAVDARGPRLLLLFMPAFALALITGFGPKSDLGHTLLLASLAVLAVVAVDAVVLGSSIVGAARREFSKAQVNAFSTGWYVFMRAHRPRSMRRPAPLVRSGPATTRRAARG